MEQANHDQEQVNHYRSSFVLMSVTAVEFATLMDVFMATLWTTEKKKSRHFLGMSVFVFGQVWTRGANNDICVAARMTIP